MQLTKKQINTLYQIILNEMARIDRKSAVGYVETLQELEIKFNTYYEQNKSN